MSRNVKVAKERCDSRVRSGIFVTARMSSRFRCWRGVRSVGSEAYPVHSWSLARSPAPVMVESSRRPIHRGYEGSDGRGWFRQ